MSEAGLWLSHSFARLLGGIFPPELAGFKMALLLASILEERVINN